MEQLLQPLRFLPSVLREDRIQCSKDRLHTELWAVLLVSCQPLFFRERLILCRILSMPIRPYNSGCRQIILLRITHTTRALTALRVSLMGKFQVVIPIRCIGGTITMGTRYKNTGRLMTWSMLGQEAA